MSDAWKHPIRFAAFDIECTGLNATYGRLLCACFKFGDEARVQTVESRKLKEERAALRDIQKIWKEVDVVVTWNGLRFDIPFLNSRLLHYNMDPMPRRMHLDLMWIRRGKFRGVRATLDAASKDAHLPVSKYNVPAESWIQASQGEDEPSVKAFKEIVKHCKEDVKVTEGMLRAYRKHIVNITMKTV